MKRSSKVCVADTNADHGGVRAIADLDDLLTALHVLADEILPRRPRARRRPRITHAELVCLAVAQILLDRPSERRFLRFAMTRLGHQFPCLPKQPGCNKREPRRYGGLGSERQRVESIIDTIKGQLSLERHGAHTMTGLISRIAQRLLALAACRRHNWKIGDPGRHLSAYDH